MIYIIKKIYMGGVVLGLKNILKVALVVFFTQISQNL
jgi:hypothetical protein